MLTIKFYLSKRSVMSDHTVTACPVVCPSTSWSHVEWMINQSVLTTTHHTRPIANWSCIAFNPNRGLDICGTNTLRGCWLSCQNEICFICKSTSRLAHHPIKPPTPFTPPPHPIHPPPPHSPHPHLPHPQPLFIIQWFRINFVNNWKVVCKWCYEKYVTNDFN